MMYPSPSWLINSLSLILGFIVTRVKPDREDISRLLKLLKPEVVFPPLVRVGPAGDGGYAVPEDFYNCDGLISPGVGKLSDFELAFAREGISCLLIDASVQSPAHEHENIVFWKKFLKATHSANSVTLEDALAEFPGASNLCLQIDIEGDEWEVLALSDSNSLARFGIIVVEFHGFAKAVLSRAGLTLAKIVFGKLTENFTIVHAHLNNASRNLVLAKKGNSPRIVLPNTFELTLVRKNRVRIVGGSTTLPSELDFPNLPDRQELEIPSEWK